MRNSNTCPPGAGDNQNGRKRAYTGGERETSFSLDEEQLRPHFHYNREERLKMSGNSVGRVDNRPWYKRSRGTLIMLLDVALIALIFIAYNLFLRPDYTSETWDNHEYQLRAVEFDSMVLATLRIEALEQITAGTEGYVSVSVYVEGFPDMFEEQLDLLPAQVQHPRLMRFRLSFPEGIEKEDVRIIADVEVLQTNSEPAGDFSLSTPVELE